MAYTYDINQSTGIGTDAMFRLKTALVAAGWTVTKSSDGTTYNSTGDQITHAGTGAGGMRNSRAWFVIRQPGSQQRELCVQRSADSTGVNYNWRMKYSAGPSTGFTGGAPAATVTPSATDEVFLLGSGADSTPTFQTLFYNSDSTPIRASIITGGASEGYNFILFCHIPQGVSATTINYCRGGVIALDVLTSTCVGDPDPVAWYVDGSANIGPFTSNLTSTSASYGPTSWFRKGLSGAGYARTPMLTLGYGTNLTIPYWIGSHSLTLDDIFLPVMYARSSALGAPVGWKGVSTLFDMIGNHRPYGTLMTRSTAGDRLVLGYVSIPWNGSILEM